jgi:hypothetical protein
MNMSKNTSRHRNPNSGDMGPLVSAFHLERQENKTATGPERIANIRRWRDPEPVAPLSAAELLREMKRLADRRGFRLRITGE